MKRYIPLLALVVVTGLALWAGSRPPDMFSPPGLAMSYVRAWLIDDRPDMERLGTVGADAREVAIASLNRAVAKSGRSVTLAEHPRTIGDRFVQPILFVASDGSSATVEVTIHTKSRKVVGLVVR